MDYNYNALKVRMIGKALDWCVLFLLRICRQVFQLIFCLKKCRKARVPERPSQDLRSSLRKSIYM